MKRAAASAAFVASTLLASTPTAIGRLAGIGGGSPRPRPRPEGPRLRRRAEASSFACVPPADFGMCTSPSGPELVEHECSASDLGSPCPDGRPGEHCCLDACGRRYCTAKGAGGSVEDDEDESPLGQSEFDALGVDVVEMNIVLEEHGMDLDSDDEEDEAAGVHVSDSLEQQVAEPSALQEEEASFTCTPPAVLNMCTSLDPSLPVTHECDAIGEPCDDGDGDGDGDGRPVDHCCEDLCGRRYCTAKAYSGLSAGMEMPSPVLAGLGGTGWEGTAGETTGTAAVDVLEEVPVQWDEGTDAEDVEADGDLDDVFPMLVDDFILELEAQEDGPV